MAGENTVATLSGNFKEKYYKEIVNTVPDHAIIASGKLVGWGKNVEKVGNAYHVPTILQSNQSWTYGGTTGGATTLLAAANAVMQDASITPDEIIGRAQISYGAMARSDGGSENAFMKAAAIVMADLRSGALDRREIEALYGQTGLGKIESYTNTSGANYDIVITAATWAPGIWVGKKGATLEAYNGSSLIGDRVLTVSAVDTSTRTVSVVQSGSSGTVAATHDLYFQGAYGKEAIGLYKQLSDSSSTLFGINRGTYSLARGSTYAVGGNISKQLMLAAAARPINHGKLANLVCLVAARTWLDLDAEEMGLRLYDSSYSPEKAVSGNAKITYRHVNGTIDVICHPLVKEGEGLMFDPKDALWVGSTSQGPVFEIPGIQAPIFEKVAGVTAYEVQCYSDMAPYHIAPAHATVLTGITHV